MTGIRLVYAIANVSGPSASAICERMSGVLATYAKPLPMLWKNGSRDIPARSAARSGTRICSVQTVATR